MGGVIGVFWLHVAFWLVDGLMRFDIKMSLFIRLDCYHCSVAGDVPAHTA